MAKYQKNKRGTTLSHHPAQNPSKPSHHACTVETTIPLSGAALRLNLGSCEDDDLPKFQRIADVPVGIGIGVVRFGLKKMNIFSDPSLRAEVDCVLCRFLQGFRGT